MAKPLSAVDCISLAFAQTKKQLFAPFRFKRWAKLAVVCILTGEFSGSGGGGSPGNFNFPTTHGRDGKSLMALPHVDWSKILPWLPWILVGVVLLFLFIFLLIYISSVFRFVLFDSVLHDRCEFKGCWTRWEPRGRSYFFWALCVSAIAFLGTGLLIGVPLLIYWRAGFFTHPGEHIAAFVLGGMALLFLLFVFVVVVAVIGLFAKDFCIPIMAMEEVGVLAAWRRLLPMVGADKLAFAGYVLMKIVLAIGSAIIVGIATLILIIALLIPLGIAALIIFLGGKALGLTFNPVTIGILISLGCVLMAGFFYLIALVCTPPMVFFQSYVLHFIGSRYEPVGAILFPPPPEIPPPAPPMDLLPPAEPPPEPAPAG
jgi:hypothetical protein